MRYLPSLAEISRHRKLIRDQAYNVALFFVSLVVSLLMVRVITDNLAPEAYGLYRYVLAVLALSTISAIPGFTKTMAGYVAQGYHATVATTTRWSFRTGTVGVAVLLVFGVHALATAADGATTALFFTAAAIFLPHTIFQRYGPVLAGLRRFRDLLVFRTISIVTLLLGAVLVLEVWEGGIVAFGVTQLFLQTTFYAIFYRFTVRRLTNTRVDEGFRRHSVIVSLVGLGSNLLTPGIQLFVNFALGGPQLAFFVIAKGIADQAAAVVKPITRPISIYLTQRGQARHNRALMRLIPLSLIGGAVLYGGIYFAIDLVGPYVIADSYEISLFYAKLLALVVVISPTYTLLSANIVFEKDNAALVSSSLAEQGVRFLGYVLFVRTYGIAAIAFTNVAAMLVQMAIILFHIQRHIRGHSGPPGSPSILQASTHPHTLRQDPTPPSV